MGKPLEYKASLVERIDLNADLAIFRVKADDSWETGIPDFIPGQYTVLGLNNEAEPDKGSVQRAYSIASPPQEKRWMEFYIRYVKVPASNNPLTHLLWKLHAGDHLFMGKKVTGHFTIPKTIGEEDPRLRVCVAAGTGLAPFYCMVKSAQMTGQSLRQFAILHGASLDGELGYIAEMTELFSEFPNQYIPTVSRSHLCPGWQGSCGRVETLMDEDKLDKLEAQLGLEPGGFNPQNVVIYICGLNGTICATIERMLKRGFVPSDPKLRKGLGLHDEAPSLFFEQYDSEPIMDVTDNEKMKALLADTPFAGRVA